MAKEGIAQLNDNTVGVTRDCGRDEDGRPIVEKVPTLASEWMMDNDGIERWQPMQTSRVFSAQCARIYSGQQRADLLKAGHIPVRDCPHSTKYSDLLKGPMAAAPEGVSPCEGATVVAIVPYSQEYKARGGRRPDSRSQEVVIPCEHYLAVRERRDKISKKKAKVRNAAEGPTKAMTDLATIMAAQNQATTAQTGELIDALRGRLKDEKDEGKARGRSTKR